MTKVRTTLVGAMGLFMGACFLVACTADTSGLTTLTVPQLAALLADNAASVLDANGAPTREKYGIIPGASLLSNYSDYDAAAELPADKARRLVFYCSSTMCSAAPTAARKAVQAGYTDVCVLPEGIKGWVGAGQPVEKPSAG